MCWGRCRCTWAGLSVGRGGREDARVPAGTVRGSLVRSGCHTFSFPAHSSQGHCGHLWGRQGWAPREVEFGASPGGLLFDH